MIMAKSKIKIDLLSSIGIKFQKLKEKIWQV